MHRTFREYDPFTGVTEEHHVDEKGNMVKLERQDVGWILEHNRHLEELEPKHACLLGPSRRRRIAEIPAVVYNKLYHEKRSPTQDKDEFFKWLNDKDNEVFRVWKGTV